MPESRNKANRRCPNIGGSVLAKKPPSKAPQHIAMPFMTLKYAEHLVLFSGETAS